MYIDERSDICWAQTNPGGSYATNGYPARLPTTLRPNLVTSGVLAAGDGVVEIGNQGDMGPRCLLLLPYGAGAAGNTFSMQILGWRSTSGVFGEVSRPPLWIPVNLGVYAVTLGTATGVTASDLPATALFPTTITMTGGPSLVGSGAAAIVPDWFQLSPGSNAIGMICQRTFGFRFLEVIFTTGGSATSCNCLYAKM